MSFRESRRFSAFNMPAASWIWRSSSSAEDVEPAFLEKLSLAKSNFRNMATAQQIYNKWVRPAVIDLPKVAAHYAIASLFEPSQGIAPYLLLWRRTRRLCRSGAGNQKAGHRAVRISSAITCESALLSFAALHLGNHQ